MAGERPKIEAAVVQAIEEGGEFTDDGFGIIRLKLAQGTVPLAFTAAQLLQLLPQLSGLLGKLKGDGGVVWRAERCRIARTLDDSLRLDFPLPGGATISLAIPMDRAAEVADRIRAEAARAPETPPEGKRH